MEWSILAAFSAGIGSAAIFSWAFSSRIRSRLWNCECDLADLQDRHLRTVRRDAAKHRWDEESQLDTKLEELVGKQTKPKGWTKWGSSNQSKSSENL